MMRERPPPNRSALPALAMGGQDKTGAKGAEGTAESGPRATSAGARDSRAGATGARHSDADAFADPLYTADIVWKRIIAHLVDAVIILLFMVPVAFVVVLAAVASFGFLLVPFAFAFMALRFIYYVGYTGSPRAATPGMRMLGIEVRTMDGGRPDLLQAFLRLAIYYVSVAFLTPLILLFVLFNIKRRTLHDMLSDTVVVNALPATEAPAAA